MSGTDFDSSSFLKQYIVDIFSRMSIKTFKRLYKKQNNSHIYFLSIDSRTYTIYKKTLDSFAAVLSNNPFCIGNYLLVKT